MKKRLIQLLRKAVVSGNNAALLRLVNLAPDATAELTKEEADLLTKMVELCTPSRLVTRNGSTVYLAPTLEEVTIWNLLETRRATDSVERIEAWTGGKYSPDTIYDAIRLDKYIVDRLKDADSLEAAIFRTPPVAGAEEADPIKEAKNLLGIIQLVAELFNTSFENAKLLNYSDAMLAIAKKHEEVEREKNEIRRRNSSR
nr:MAG TPA: hypothetical protein [Bacteriophage sp.]